jgi:hypothetical protein
MLNKVIIDTMEYAVEVAIIEAESGGTNVSQHGSLFSIKS